MLIRDGMCGASPIPIWKQGGRSVICEALEQGGFPVHRLQRSRSIPSPRSQPPAVSADTLVHSTTLVEDLTAERTAALRLEFANNHHVALASVVHSLLLQTALTHSRDHSCLDIVLTSKSLEASMKAPATNLAIVGLVELAERFGDHVPGNTADIFEWCLGRDHHELVELLAFAASHAIDAVKDKYDYRKTQRAHAEVLAQALDLDMTNYFEATAESYFNYLSRDGIEATLTEIKGPDFASGIGRVKKAEAQPMRRRRPKEAHGSPPRSAQRSATAMRAKVRQRWLA